MGKRALSREAVLDLADRFSAAADGSKPKYLSGGYRWSERNESAVVTTYSPDGVKVVCVVSIFADGSSAIAFFSSESLSGTDTFENITHFTYTGSSVRAMMSDLKWVWKTVDEYKASWEEG